MVGSWFLVLFLAHPAASQESVPADSEAARFIEGVSGSSQPDRSMLESIDAAGYEAVIDLRGADEDRGIDERAAVEGLGMTYISLPILGAGDISYDNANELDRLLAGFEKPVLVHCGSGNRAGALLALRAKLNGADNDAAVEAGRRTGLTELEDVVRQRLNER
jgi:uncharacterized protein (TIGR01244 family)